VSRAAAIAMLLLATACGSDDPAGTTWVSDEAVARFAGWQETTVTLNLQTPPEGGVDQAFFVVGVLVPEDGVPVRTLPKGKPPEFHYTLPARERTLPIVETIRLPHPVTLFAMYDFDGNGLPGGGDASSTPVEFLSAESTGVTLTVESPGRVGPVRAGTLADPKPDP